MYEDTDYCTRIRQAGYRIRYYPAATITHLGGQSWKQEKVATYTNSHVAALQYMEKHFPRDAERVRRAHRVGMRGKAFLLRLALIRSPRNLELLERLQMTKSAYDALSPAAARARSRPHETAYVSTLDHIIRAMLPHLEGAKRAGYRVEVACRVTRFGDDVRKVADAVHDVPMSRFPVHSSNLQALKMVTDLIRRERYDVVHSHNPSGGFIGRLAATNAGTGALRVYTAHGFHFHRHGHPVANSIYETIERYAGHRLSDAVYVYNREDYDAALAKKVVPDERLFLTRGIGISAREQFNPEIVSDEERTAFRQEIGADAETPVLSWSAKCFPQAPVRRDTGDAADRCGSPEDFAGAGRRRRDAGK
jgi:hypothetical protein